MLKYLLFAATILTATTAYANQTPIQGTVESRCVIYTDTAGVYGNPSADKLSTDPSAGGVKPVIRIDVVLADAYKALISWPNSFSTSPSLDDTVSWSGDVTVSQVSDTNMSAYETNKVEYNNIVEYDLTVAGSTWFTIDSLIEYGVGKSLPAGTYIAVVTAQCIAK